MKQANIVIILWCSLFIATTAKADLYSVSDAVEEAQTADVVTNTLHTVNKLDHQYQVMNQQLTSLNRTIQNLQNIGEYDTASQYIEQINNIMRQTNAIYGSIKFIDKDFQTLYPGYQPSNKSINTSLQYETMVNSTLNTLDDVVASTTQISNEMNSNKSNLSDLQAQAKTVQGQTQAIQLSNQLLAQLSSQTELVQQMMVAQTQAQSAYYAEQMQQQARTNADISNAIANGTTTAPAIGHSGHYISLPTSLNY